MNRAQFVHCMWCHRRSSSIYQQTSNRKHTLKHTITYCYNLSLDFNTRQFSDHCCWLNWNSQILILYFLQYEVSPFLKTVIPRTITITIYDNLLIFNSVFYTATSNSMQMLMQWSSIRTNTLLPMRFQNIRHSWRPQIYCKVSRSVDRKLPNIL